ncbi:MAG: ribose 5-phosphate isomerase B [Myxococcales bacterium]|nr:ribose 5-phosphate isomerase B [Myxococcales bacterium]MCB9702718.1 ribose 5-phosphate isomerase B [Myxococcales bacterium]
MRLHLGSDHGGVEYRKMLAGVLREAGHEVASEEGPASAGDSVDYPDVARDVCRQVLGDPGSLGILVCGTGQGMAMAANKVAGIRAAVVADPFSATMAREHNDANILCIGQRVLGSELAKMLVMTFLGATFAGGRHARRVAKIDAAGGP